MDVTTKTMLARRDSEMEKLEKSERSQLRMIMSSVAKLKQKFSRAEEENQSGEETEATKIRMYKTHNPGFCYLRNGEYRKKNSCGSVTSTIDPIQCSERVKAILFTDNELDIEKTMCLHLLGTHLQSKNHIQKKDGKMCSYVKAQVAGNTTNTLQSISQRLSTRMSDEPSKYDKMLPRYILDVKLLNCNMSICSVKSSDYDSGSDDESKRKRKLLVPVYINNEIRMIINSVLEALQVVESPKLQALIDLASSPEELRNLFDKEEIQDYMIDLAGNPLIMKPTSYDYVMALTMFDKIPEKGTLETVAQVLEVCDHSELRDCLSKIRRCLFQRHMDLVNSNILPGKKSTMSDKMASADNLKYFNSSWQYITGIARPSMESNVSKSKKYLTFRQKEDSGLNKRKESNKKDKNVTMDISSLDESDGTDNSGYSQPRSSIESTKCDLRQISNAQRILVGLKVASLKNKPPNLHQFEGKKKVDLASIINPIIRPQESEIDATSRQSSDNQLRNFTLPEKRPRKSVSRTSTIPIGDLENLTRPLLANLRLEISESENKRRVNQFMDRINKRK